MDTLYNIIKLRKRVNELLELNECIRIKIRIGKAQIFIRVYSRYSRYSCNSLTLPLLFVFVRVFSW